MFDYICFAAGTAVFIFSFLKAVRNRHSTGRFISNFLIGVFLSSFLFVLPTDWVGESVPAFRRILTVFLSSLFYSFESLGGKADIAQLETIELNVVFKNIYFAICTLSHALAPLLASSLIISCFGDMGERLRYALHFSRDCHVFSELNDNSFALAKGIKSKNRHTTVVFCGTKNADKATLEKAKKNGGIMFHKPCENFRPGFKHRHYEFYLISADEDKNISAAETILQKSSRVRPGRLTVNAFAQSGTNIKVVESIEKENIRLRFIDEVALFCNNLLFEHPLYDIPEGKRDISVMVVGCGRMGMQMLKTVAWCGQIGGYTLKIRAYDRDAQRVKDEFFALCPELDSSEYDIGFVEADVKSSDFEQSMRESFDATYVVVSTNDDGLNISVADSLRGIFRRANGTFGYDPPIFARVRSGVKAANLNRCKKNYLDDRNIFLFGNTENIFSENTLFNTRLERLSLAVHLSYCGALDLDRGSEEYKKQSFAFETDEYNRRNSMASALHIPAKLVSCGIMSPDEHELTDAAASAFEASLADFRDTLAEGEHSRWNAFMRSEGFRGTDTETMKSYAKKVGSNKDVRSKLHPCITGWEELDRVTEEYNSFMSDVPGFRPVDFKKSDYDIVDAIPAIIRFANSEK